MRERKEEDYTVGGAYEVAGFQTQTMRVAIVDDDPVASFIALWDLILRTFLKGRGGVIGLSALRKFFLPQGRNDAGKMRIHAQVVLCDES